MCFEAVTTLREIKNAASPIRVLADHIERDPNALHPLVCAPAKPWRKAANTAWSKRMDSERQFSEACREEPEIFRPLW
jgi:hypothetical protein